MKTFVRILCVLLAVLACAGLFVSSSAAIVLISVRRSLNPAFVRETTENLDFASIRFPDGFGGFTTIPQQLNEVFASQGFAMSDEQFNSLCRDMGFGAVLRDYCLAFRSWLFDDGPIPQADLRGAAEAAAGGAADGLMFVRDPASFALAMLAAYVNEQALESRMTSLAPARELLSRGTLALVLSAVLTFALDMDDRSGRHIVDGRPDGIGKKVEVFGASVPGKNPESLRIPYDLRKRIVDQEIDGFAERIHQRASWQ